MGKKKYNLEFCKNLAIEYNGICLSDNYINNISELEWVCEKNHRFTRTLSYIKRYHKFCPICFIKEDRSCNIKLYQDYAAKYGGTCLSKEYVNRNNKQEWQCEKGHKFIRVFNSMKHNNTFCPTCQKQKPRLSLEDYRSIALKYEGKYLLDKPFFENVLTKWECKNGHVFEKSFFKIRRLKSFCPECHHKVIKKRTTLEDLRKLAIDNKGVCLSKDLVSMNQDIEWQCEKGHKFIRKLHTIKGRIKKGLKFCPLCNEIRKKYTINFCRELAKKHKSICLSNKYINIYTQLLWQCSEGHKFNNNLGTMIKRSNKDNFCSICAEENKIKEIKEYCKQLSLKFVEYAGIINGQSKYKVECFKGHVTYKTYGNLKALKGCGHVECYGEKISKSILLDRDTVIKNIEEKCNLTCLNPNDYEGASYRLLWKCNRDDHEFLGEPDKLKGAIKRGVFGCPLCGKKAIDIRKVLEIIKNHNGKFVQYVIKKQKEKNRIANKKYLEIVCEENHTFIIAPHDLYKGVWCPECSTSLGERITRAYFEQIFNKPFPKIRPDWLINPSTGRLLELDIFNEELRLAAEHQGSQHYGSTKTHMNHTKEDLEKIQYRDKVKRKLCKKNNVVLIEVPEIYVLLKLENLKEYLKKELLKNNVKLPNNYDEIQFDISKIYKSDSSMYLKNLQESAKAFGGKLLDTEYRGFHARYKCKCKEGHIFYKDANKETWCPKCNGGYKNTLQTLIDIAEKLNIKSLTTEYTNNRTSCLWECNKGHQWYARLTHIQKQLNQGVTNVCAKCRKEEKIGNR